MSVLPDIIDINLRLLICGYNAGPVSARTGHYFSNPKHRVWKTLYEVKLTPGILTPEEDGELLQYGIGLTDLMKNSIHGDGTTPTDWDRDLLREKVLRYQPDNLVFLGKWLILAYVLESLMLAYVPAAWIAAAVGDGGLASIGVASLVGVPAYLNGYAALPLVAGLMDTGMAPGACMAFLIAGGMTSIPAAIAVFALARLPVFAAYLTFALAGSMASGLAYQFWVTV